MESKFNFILAGIIALSFPVGVYCADYPTKPITLQVPWPAGGAASVGAHILATIAEKKMGQPVVIVNKPGAGSQVGLTELAKAKPDGYYIGSVTLPTLSTVMLDPERKGHVSSSSPRNYGATLIPYERMPCPIDYIGFSKYYFWLDLGYRLQSSPIKQL